MIWRMPIKIPVECDGLRLETAAKLGGAGGNVAFGDLIDLPGEGEILGGDLVAGGMGGKGEVDRPVTDVDVGMVIGGLGEGGDFQDQGDGLDEVGPLQGAGEGITLLRPAGRRGLVHQRILGCA